MPKKITFPLTEDRERLLLEVQAQFPGVPIIGLLEAGLYALLTPNRRSAVERDTDTLATARLLYQSSLDAQQRAKTDLA